MTEQPSQLDTDRLVAEMREARLVYGAILVDGQLKIVECIEEEAFVEGERERALNTAFASIGANLVPFVTEMEDELDPDVPAAAAPHRTDDVEMATLSQFSRAASQVARAGVYYLLLNSTENDWKRVQNTATSNLENLDPELGRFLVSSALVEVAGERLADLSTDVDPSDIDIIDWSST